MAGAYPLLTASACTCVALSQLPLSAYGLCFMQSREQAAVQYLLHGANEPMLMIRTSHGLPLRSAMRVTVRSSCRRSALVARRLREGTSSDAC